MKTELDILREVSKRLDAAGIQYMVTGSVAMNYYTQPRMTRDIDVVMALKDSDAVRLLALSGSERVVMGSCMFDSARAIILSSFPSDISEVEIKRQLCERLYGNEVDLAGFVESLTASLERSKAIRDQR